MKKLLTLFTALLFLGGLMSVQADIWTVAGEPAEVFGTTWTPSIAANVMVEQSDGTYRWEKDNVNANYATFKVVEGNAWGTEYPSSNYTINFTSGSKLAITFDPDTKAVNAYNPGVYIGVHGSMTTSSWATSQFTVSGDEETASFTFTDLPNGDYQFGMRIGANDNWTSNGVSFTRNNKSRVITSGSGNCTFNADIDGDYTFTWTYATKTLTISYPDLPAQSVVFDDLAAQILKGTAVTFAATATNITNPVYSYYVKPAEGEYGSAVSSYTFNEEGAYTVKVSVVGDNTTEPVIAEKNVTVYNTYTFTKGTRIYVDFSAVSGDVKGVNYPYGDQINNLNYDANGAGTFKTVQFTADVTWSTLNDFIKTEKAGWAGLKFTAPGEGQNKIIVAVDGASYTWGTYTPETVQVKFFAPKNVQHPWSNVYAHSWDGIGELTTWPGDEVTVKDGVWYVYTVQKGANLLFHDGNGMQTYDINNITADVCYVPTAIEEDDDNPETPLHVTLTEQCTVDYYISGTKELTGLTEDWVVADAGLKLDANNQIVFHNLEAGTYEFKITNGTWAWSIGGNDHLMTGECASIATTEGLGNVGFTIASKQDVTITYYPETEKICLGAVTVKTTATLTVNDFGIEAGESKQISYWTNNTEATGVNYEVLSGTANIHLNAGVILGIKAGTATVRATIAETANYTAASDEFTVTVTTPTAPAIAPIAPIGGKFTINAHGDTAIFARGNLQYQQSSHTWRCAPNQFEWKGTDNLQMGNSEYEGWVDLFCWSIGDENNYGATSAYLTTLYYNKDFVDWGGLFTDTYEWSTLSINEWYYLLYSRANANNLWGMAMIDDNLGMIILPDEWIAPSGVTFVAGTIPTTDMWHNSDCLDPTHADEDHWRINSNNLPANKFTQSEWTILEAAGAVFLPYGGRRSGGYGNHTNRQDQTVDYEYAYSYYENYYGSYWTSTVAKPAEGKSYWLPMICGGCDANHENWGRGSHGWWENGRYGHSVRLVTRIPKQEEPEWQTVRSGLTAGNYYTVCYNKNMSDVRGATLWSFAGKESDLAYLVQEDGPYAAGTPYIVYAESDKLEAIVEEVALPVAGDKNGLYGTFSLMDQTAIDAVGKDVYLLIGNQLRQANGRSGNSLPAYRAYVVFSEITGGEPKGMAPGRVRRISMQPNAATGMDEISDPSSNIRKVLKDGQLLILRGENLYDATGRMVK